MPNKIISFLIAICLMSTAFSGMAQVPSATPRHAATAVAKPPALKVTKLSSIRTWIPSMITTDQYKVSDSSRATADVKLTTQYFDGLGRPIQTVARRFSPGGNDLVTPFVYDSLGRTQFQYLPYVQQNDSAHNGKIKSDPFVAQASFYEDANLNPGVAGEHVFYSQTEYEVSPLNRVLQTWAPGDSWAKTGDDHSKKIQYLFNTTTDAVRIWNIALNRKNCSYVPAVIPTSTTTYAPGQLTKTIITDEAGHQIIEYKDKSDLLILKKVQETETPQGPYNGWLCTYYIYDDLNNLCFVIPPLAVQKVQSTWNIPADIAHELCFQYQYDARGRMISKKMPGAGPVLMAYDGRNRLVFTQDSLQRIKSSGAEWMTVFYDGLNRPHETGIYTTNSIRDVLQCSVTTNLDDTTAINPSIPIDLVVTTYKSTDTAYIATGSITFEPGFQTSDNTNIQTYIIAYVGATNRISSNPVPVISSELLLPLTYTYYDSYNFDGAQHFCKC